MTDPGEVGFSDCLPRQHGPATPQREAPCKTVYLLDRVAVRDLATGIGLKPFQIVAELLRMKQFKQADDQIDFDTAARIARKHGYQAEPPPEGVLVL
jgi:translation initiation factor IF-2